MSKNRSNNLSGIEGDFPDSNDSRETEKFIRALEGDDPNADSMSAEDREVYRFGTAIRLAAQLDLPVPNESLREQLIAKLDHESFSETLPKVASQISDRSFSRLALAACLLLSLGLIAIVFALNQADREVGMRMDSDLHGVVGIKGGHAVNGDSSDDAPSGFFQYKADEETKELDSIADDESDVNGLRSDLDAPTVAMLTRRVNPTTIAEITIAGNDSADNLSSLYSLQSNQNRLDTSDEQQLQAQVANQIRESLQGGIGGLGGRGGGGFGGDVGGVGVERGAGLGTRELNELDETIEMFNGQIGSRVTTRSGQLYERDNDNEQYDPIVENEFTSVKGNQALSTFSIDVDTASYANMRRFLLAGQRPPRNSIRIEELVNYFNYDYPQPEGDRPFAVDMEIASCPWNDQHHLLRVALKGKEVHRNERSPSNLVFLLDVSGSMQSDDKLPLLKQGLTMMVQQLSENDSISIVTYAGNAGVALNPTNGNSKRQIEMAIEQLSAGGSTNGSAGIELAYELAQKQFIHTGSNRVILATDGDLNVGVTSDNALVQLISEKASEGVFLTVLGFGTGNLKDSKLEKLADNGNGMYAYVDGVREAHKVLIEQMSGSLETIAKDVKIQIEFNPAEVAGYRLIGYENRVLAAHDFDNDRKDAGEIGAGHSVTALYELVLKGVSQNVDVAQGSLKYQTPEPAGLDKKEADVSKDAKHAGELLTLALRYKKPDAQQSERIEYTLDDEPKSFSSASGEFRFAASVASFGMILRDSRYRGNTDLKWVEETASRSLGDDVGGYRSEFLALVRAAALAR